MMVKLLLFIIIGGSCQAIIYTKKQKNDSLKGKDERNVALLVLLGEVLYDAVP
jgi:hypothetical protein